jgi:hypothetical protein
MDEKSFKIIFPLIREKDCSGVGSSLVEIVLKSKRNFNQNYWAWENSPPPVLVQG